MIKRLALLALLAGASTAHADSLNLATLDGEPNRVTVTTGAEYAFVVGAGYSRIVPILGRRAVLTGDVTLPFADLDVSDYRVRASALVPLVGAGRRWQLAASLAPSLRGTHNAIGDLADVGLDTAVVGGYYARRFYVAGELGLDAALTTHVHHTDAYRMNVDATAVDGWYAATGGNARAGLQAGLAVGRYDVILRAGQVRDVTGAAPLFPFYGTVAVAARF